MQLPPKRILEPERFIMYEGSENSLLLTAVLNLITKDNLIICDVGGATGIFLNEILLRSKYKIKAVIIDIDNFYKNKVVNKSIQFINQSILHNNIKDKSFDIVIFRHLLHHLVSNNLKNTFKIQKEALNEIFRITKKDGSVIFIEQINRSDIFSRLIYFLSKIANKFNIKLQFFNTGTVIVYFLNRKKIEDLLAIFKEKYNLFIKKKQYFPWKLPMRWRLTLLMSKVGSVFYIIEVKNRPKC